MPLLLRPLGPALARLVVQHLREERLELLVALELQLDLPQEALGDRPGVAEDSDRDLRVGQDVLDRLAEGDDGALVVLARPEVQVTVGAGLDFAAAVVEPIAINVGTAQQFDQQKEEIPLGQFLYHLSPRRILRPLQQPVIALDRRRPGLSQGRAAPLTPWRPPGPLNVQREETVAGQRGAQVAFRRRAKREAKKENAHKVSLRAQHS